MTETAVDRLAQMAEDLSREKEKLSVALDQSQRRERELRALVDLAVASQGTCAWCDNALDEEDVARQHDHDCPAARLMGW